MLREALVCHDIMHHVLLINHAIDHALPCQSCSIMLFVKNRYGSVWLEILQAEKLSLSAHARHRVMTTFAYCEHATVSCLYGYGVQIFPLNSAIATVIAKLHVK